MGETSRSLPPSRSAARGMIATRKRVASADSAFRIVVTIAGCLILVLIVGLVVFLLVEAMPAIRHYGFLSFLSSTRWAPSEANPLRTTPNPYGIFQVIYGTTLTSAVAMLMAVPRSVRVAPFLPDAAPAALRRPLSSLVALLAAVPSVVYGFWGVFALIPVLLPIGRDPAWKLGRCAGRGVLFW